MPGHRSLYEYNADWHIHALDWRKDTRNQLAIGSFIEADENKIQVLSLHDDDYGMREPNNAFEVMAEADIHYPLTKLLWKPFSDEDSTNILATTSDILCTWELVDNPRYGNTSNAINRSSGRYPSEYRQRLEKKAELVNKKNDERNAAPLTSFDWNERDPSTVVTASIDTTCTVWNVETNQAKTQLIAHDAEVFDVAYKPGSTDIFSTVSKDGSVRLFDLRSLKHSTIIYEAPPWSGPNNDRAHYNSTGHENALLRLQFSPFDSDLLATFQINSKSVQILDIRNPSAPVAELTESHRASVNHLAWSPTERKICTCGDDSQALIWDLDSVRSGQQLTQKKFTTPKFAYEANEGKSAITSVSWNKRRSEWIGICFDNTVQALRYTNNTNDRPLPVMR